VGKALQALFEINADVWQMQESLTAHGHTAKSLVQNELLLPTITAALSEARPRIFVMGI